MTAAVADDDLVRSALTEALIAAGIGRPAEIVRLRSERRSTFPLERLQVMIGDGKQSQVAFKRLEWEGLTLEGRIAKPSFLFDPAREPAVYSSVLPRAPAGPPRYLGSLPGDGGGRWLFLEWVQGRELHQVGELSLWAAAARWLGCLHVALADDVDRHARAASLIEHGAAYCRLWLQRARQFAGEDGRASAAARFLDRLQKRYEVVIEALLTLPRTVIHGDFYASNVLIGDGAGEAPRDDRAPAVRVAPVDWEMAAVGPGLLDLTALISGDWEDGEREAMVAAYASVPGTPPFTQAQLDLARLHHAVQRLGWAPPQWQPPQEQRHDWLAEAIALAEGIGL